MERHYIVTWDIDMWAGSPEEAVEMAQDLLRQSLDWVYGVKDADTGETWSVDTEMDRTRVIP